MSEILFHHCPFLPAEIANIVYSDEGVNGKPIEGYEPFKDLNEKQNNMKLRAIVVDDEELARKNLVMLLEEYCTDIEVIGEASGKNQAKAIIEASRPDVSFSGYSYAFRIRRI